VNFLSRTCFLEREGTEAAAETIIQLYALLLCLTLGFLMLEKINKIKT